MSTFLLWRLDWVVPIRQRIWRKLTQDIFTISWADVDISFQKTATTYLLNKSVQVQLRQNFCVGQMLVKRTYKQANICTRSYPKIPANQCFSQRQVEMQFVAFDVVILCICMFFPLSYFWMYLHVLCISIWIWRGWNDNSALHWSMGGLSTHTSYLSPARKQCLWRIKLVWNNQTNYSVLNLVCLRSEEQISHRIAV